MQAIKATLLHLNIQCWVDVDFHLTKSTVKTKKLLCQPDYILDYAHQISLSQMVVIIVVHNIIKLGVALIK